MRRAISMIVELFMLAVRVEQNLAHAGFQLDVRQQFIRQDWVVINNSSGARPTPTCEYLISYRAELDQHLNQAIQVELRLNF